MKELTDKQIQQLFPFPPRGKQEEIVKKILEAYRNGKQHVVLSLPTGGGKSVIAYAIAKYFNSAYVLTNQKILQEQYRKDLHVPYILGRNNYICKKDNNLTCELGVCKRETKLFCKDCPYLLHKDAARHSWITNMNYAYFLNIIKANQIEPRSILIMDEAHVLENELLKAGTIRITERILHILGIYNLTLPKVKESDYNKQTWLFSKLLPKLREQFLYYKNQIKTYQNFKFSRETQKLIHKYMALDRLVSILLEIQKELEDKQKIIIQSGEDFIDCKLLYGYNLFEKYFAKYGKVFLHMSATILNKEQYCKKLNLASEDVEYIEYESEFPIENRLIHYIPVGSLSWKNKAKTIPILIKKVEELLNTHKNEKGIIHTVNYELAEIITNELYDKPCGHRLLIPRGSNRQTILDTFYESKNPYVLISPSLTEGLDLKDELSRFCIICKMPFANISDKWIKTRMVLDQTWYNNFTAEQLIQMTGRSIRSKDDYATTYILDQDFMYFAQNNYYLLPQWWKNAVIERIKIKVTFCKMLPYTYNIFI